jgi:ankyrin repeat protein
MTTSSRAAFFAVLLAAIAVGGCVRSIDEDLVNTAYFGDVHQIRVLLQRGADPNALAMDDWTALTVASREGHVEAVKLLLHSGANIDLPEGGGNTALYWAAFDDRRDVIKLLIAEGANINKKNKAKGAETPLHVAIRLNHPEAAELLREAGAKQ